MNPVDLVAVLALIQLVFFSALVGLARARSGLKAPAVTGNERFERMYRVQMNTLELLVVLLPALYIAAKYWPPSWVAGAGAVYLLGRLLYWRAYVVDPAKRELGFSLSMLPILVLLVTALVDIVKAGL